MKKRRTACLVNVCIGAYLLAYGLWMVYTSVQLLVRFFGPEAYGESVRNAYSMLLWWVLLIDYLRSVLCGVLTIFPFICRKSGKYIWSVACINLVYVLLVEIPYKRELGFSMIQLNHKRLLLPILLILIGICWQHYYKKNEEQISRFFPYIGEFVKLVKK